MAKKSINPYVDSLKELKAFMSKMKSISDIMYIYSPRMVCIRTINDYQKHVVLLPEDSPLASYSGVVFETLRQYPELSELRKTACDIHKEGDKIVFENLHKDHMNEKFTCITNESKDTEDDVYLVNRVLTGMYINDFGVDYLALIMNTDRDNMCTFDGGLLKGLVESKVYYYDCSDNHPFMISRESFPLVSDKTLEFSFKILTETEDDSSFMVLFQQKEETYTLLTLMRFLKDS